MLKAGQIIDLRIESLAYGGDAVGHHQGQAIFVPYGVPGDRLQVRITDPHKSYSRGKICNITEASPDRKEPDCPYFGDCGSCQWQMMDYDHQMQSKKEITKDVFKRLGGIDITDIEVVPNSSGWHYRNKAQYPVQTSRTGNLIGYYRAGSHSIVDITSCPLVDKNIDSAYSKIREIINQSGIKGYNEKTHSGSLRHLIMRYSSHQKAVSLIMVTRFEPDISRIAESIMSRISSVKSVWQNINRTKGNVILGGKWKHLGGEKFLIEKIGQIQYRLSPGSFLQSNLETAGRIYQLIVENLTLSSKDIVTDLYSGMGSIALQLAGSAGKVVAIEEFGPAVEDAKANTILNGIGNCEFLCGKVANLLAGLGKADVVVLDPPRQGAGPDVIKTIVKLGPSRIAYLSCNPSTLARDAASLKEQGYLLRKMFMADMFPQTYHIENLAIFTR
jgi:23S rRNA (uracil1939-C5)-methyltransferase